MPRKPFSFNQFDGVNPTARLFEKIMRDAVDYTKEIDDVFDAIVLTEPTLASANADAIISNKVKSQQEKDSSKVTNYIFIVRIIGPDSPHNFLPDPIDFYVTNDEECKKRYHNLLQLHTKVSAKGLSDLELPSKGDQVQIKLKKSDYVYDTQWSRDFMGITSRAAANSEVKKRLVKNASNAFKSSTPTTPAASTGKKIALQAAYLELNAEAGSNKITEQEIYNYLSNDFRDVPKYHNLILGIMANIKAESGYDANIVSRAGGSTLGESSIGLFQMNVGSRGRSGPPRSGMSAQLKGAGVPAELVVKSSNVNVPYFAGSLYLQNRHGIVAITPDKFDGNKESVRPLYNALIKWKEQLSFAAVTADNLLPIPIENINNYDPTVWSSWFQVYFEQPAKIKPRTPPNIQPPPAA